MEMPVPRLLEKPAASAHPGRPIRTPSRSGHRLAAWCRGRAEVDHRHSRWLRFSRATTGNGVWSTRAEFVEGNEGVLLMCVHTRHRSTAEG